MVEFALSEEQEMLRELAHEFARDIVRPNAEHWDDKSEFPTEAIAEAHALGLTNLHIPAEYGGMGMGILDEVLVSEEFSWGDPGFGTAAYSNGLTVGPVITGGTEEQKAYFLPKFASGEIIGSFALTEPDAGSDAGSLATKAAADPLARRRPGRRARASGSCTRRPQSRRPPACSSPSWFRT